MDQDADDYYPEAMLRFKVWNAQAGEIAARLGTQVCPPVKSRPGFNVVVSEAVTFDAQLAEADAFLNRNRNAIQDLLAVEGQHGEMEFTLVQKPNIAVSSHPYPPAFLRLVSDLGLDLCVNVYW